MKIEEACKTYGIPTNILQEYENWNLCGKSKASRGALCYDKADIERLSLILTLHDLGFSSEEVERYMRLQLSDKDSTQKRMAMLSERRNATLDEIHFRQERIDRLDYLRFEIKKGK